MGTISLVQPVVGQPDTTEDVKIQNNFTTIQNVINGNIDDSNLKSPNSGVRRLLLQASTTASGVGPGTLPISDFPPAWLGDSGISSQPQDFQVAGKTAYGRIRAGVIPNSINPSVTLTFGLYPVTASGGASGTINYTFGTAVSGSTFNLTPTNASFVSGESTQFTLPTNAQFYMLGVVYSTTIAAGAVISITSQLYGYNA